MSNSVSIVGGIMALLHRGQVSIELRDPEISTEELRDNVPCVRVTSKGKTWQQPIRRAFGHVKSTPEEIAEALGVAVERCVGNGSSQATAAEDL